MTPPPSPPPPGPAPPAPTHPRQRPVCRARPPGARPARHHHRDRKGPATAPPAPGPATPAARPPTSGAGPWLGGPPGSPPAPAGTAPSGARHAHAHPGTGPAPARTRTRPGPGGRRTPAAAPLGCRRSRAPAASPGPPRVPRTAPRAGSAARPPPRCCRSRWPQTAIACNTRMSNARHAPSRPCTFADTATCVCKFGSPSAESGWSNAAATRPFVSTCAIPALPVRVSAASRSTNANARCQAASCAACTWVRMCSSPSAHRTDTDFTGVNTRSTPATGCRGGLATRAMNAFSSCVVGRLPLLGLPEQLGGDAPADQDPAPGRAVAVGHARSGTPRMPRPVASATPPRCRRSPGTAGPAAPTPPPARPTCPRATAACMRGCASGCTPSPNSAFICASDTSPCTSIAARPEPTHRPARVALRRVVIRQCLTTPARHIARRHLPGQVRVPIAGVQHVHRHHPDRPSFALTVRPNPDAPACSRPPFIGASHAPNPVDTQWHSTDPIAAAHDDWDNGQAIVPARGRGGQCAQRRPAVAVSLDASGLGPFRPEAGREGTAGCALSTTDAVPVPVVGRIRVDCRSTVIHRLAAQSVLLRDECSCARAELDC